MACYDCEECSMNVEFGGKCNRFEYDCPFLIVEKYDSKKLKAIRETVNKISQTIESLKGLDTEEYMEDEIDRLSYSLSLFENKISENIEKEWNEISINK